MVVESQRGPSPPPPPPKLEVGTKNFSPSCGCQILFNVWNLPTKCFNFCSHGHDDDDAVVKLQEEEEEELLAAASRH